MSINFAVLRYRNTREPPLERQICPVPVQGPPGRLIRKPMWIGSPPPHVRRAKLLMRPDRRNYQCQTCMVLMLSLLPLVAPDPRARCATAQAKLREQILDAVATELVVRETCSPLEGPGWCASACADLVQELWALRVKSALDGEIIAELRSQRAEVDQHERCADVPIRALQPCGPSSATQVRGSDIPPEGHSLGRCARWRHLVLPAPVLKIACRGTRGDVGHGPEQEERSAGCMRGRHIRRYYAGLCFGSIRCAALRAQCKCFAARSAEPVYPIGVAATLLRSSDDDLAPSRRAGDAQYNTGGTACAATCRPCRRRSYVPALASFLF
jgi:hypothetical protein